MESYMREIALYNGYKRNKAKRTAAIETYQVSIKNARKRLRLALSAVKDTVIYGENGESCTVIYSEPFFFQGTKQEAKECLWENYATRLCSGCDCSGRSFTTDFKLASLGNGNWKVAESFSVDV